MINGISYKTLIGSKPFQVTFNKLDGIIRIYDETRYYHCFALKNMMLFTTELDISVKGSITYIFSHYFAKIQVDFYDSLPMEKILTLHNP